jgi:hypothetical protein
MKPKMLTGALFLILFVPGCGGGSGEGASSQATVAVDAAAPSAAAVADGEAICAAMIARSSRMGAQFSANPDLDADALTLTTQKLIKPAVSIVESSASQLRALRPEANSVDFDSYVSLFDPIIALLRERVVAGEAGDRDRARDLELQLLDLVELQRGLARQAGLNTCDVDFIQTFARGNPK